MATVTSRPATDIPSPSSKRPLKIVVLVVLVVVAVAVAGVVGYAIGNSGDKSSTTTVSNTDAKDRYFALALFTDHLCPGFPAGAKEPGAFDCQTALAATAAMISGTTWPEGAKAAAAALVTAIDKHVALLQSLDRATPAEQQKILAPILKNPSNSPWQQTQRAGTAMREAIGLPGGGSPL